MNQLPQYEDRLVAFVDILGFKNIISSISEDQELHKRLHRVLTFNSHQKQSHSETGDLEFSVFSDSIVISSEMDNAFALFWRCGWIQSQLLQSGILTRGGISIGPTFHKDDVLYGEGMLKAYRIECKAAVYPRLVVDPEILPRLESLIRNRFLNQDTDGLWFVNVFSFYGTLADADDLEEAESSEGLFKEIGEHISAAIKSAKHADHLAKWKWMENRYKIASKNYLKDYELNLADLLLEKLRSK